MAQAVPWITAAIGAWSSYDSSKRNQRASEKAADAASAPTWAELRPYEKVDPYLSHWIYGTQSTLENQQPSYYKAPPPGGGMGQGSRDLISALSGGDLYNTGFSGDLRDYITGTLGDAGTNFGQRAFNSAEGYRPDYYDAAIQGLAGGALDNPYLQDFIEGRQYGGKGGTPEFSPEMMDALRGGGMSYSGGPIGAKPQGLGEPTNDWMRAVLDGEFLGMENNPGLQAMIDDVRQQGLQTYRESVVPQIDAGFNRAGRYGSGAYSAAQAQANERANRAIGAESANLIGTNYESERDRMIQALLGLNSLDQTRINAAAQQASAGSGAGASMANARLAALTDLEIARMLDGRERDRTLLDAIGGWSGDRLSAAQLGANMIGGLNQSDLAALQMMGGLADSDMAFRSNLLGAGNDNFNAQLGGMGTALQGSLQGDSQRNAGNMARWQAGKDRHDYFRDFELNRNLTGLDIFSNLAAQFGRQVGQGQQYVPTYNGNPWAAALQGGAGGYMTGRGLQGQGQTGGGGGGGKGGKGGGGGFGGGGK